MENEPLNESEELFKDVQIYPLEPFVGSHLVKEANKSIQDRGEVVLCPLYPSKSVRILDARKSGRDNIILREFVHYTIEFVDHEKLMEIDERIGTRLFRYLELPIYSMPEILLARHKRYQPLFCDFLQEMPDHPVGVLFKPADTKVLLINSLALEL